MITIKNIRQWIQLPSLTGRGWGVSLLIGLLVFLASCSQDEQRPEFAVEVRSYVASFEEETAKTRATADEAWPYGAVTRAWDMPTGFMAYEDGDKPIGIAFTRNGEDPEVGADPLHPKSMMGYFFKSSGKWRTDIEIPSAATYYLYGYIPNYTGVTFGVSDRDDLDANYSAGAKVTLENVPAIMPNDLCVVIGAKDGTDKETVSGLRQGDFAYSAKAITGGSDAGNYVFLLFDHLYAALRVTMKVDATYNELRTIVLKKLALQTLVGDTPSKQKTNITVMLKATDGSDPDESPITGITYDPQGEDIDKQGLEFWSSPSGETLGTGYMSFVGHFMPDNISKMVLNSTYDVYDKKGNLVRQNCLAANTMVLEDLFTGQETTLRGRRYTIKLTIKPTYLYVLSDPDLDNPTIEVTP